MFFEKILWSFQGFISVPCQPSGRRGISSGCSSVNNICPDDEIFPSGRPSVSRSFEQFKDCIYPGVMANRLDALQNSRKSQCSSTSIGTTWLYRPDAIQCLTRNRISASRHSYGKMAATVRTMCDPVRMMSSLRQERAYQVQPSGRQPSWSERSSFI